MIIANQFFHIILIMLQDLTGSNKIVNDNYYQKLSKYSRKRTLNCIKTQYYYIEENYPKIK